MSQQWELVEKFNRKVLGIQPRAHELQSIDEMLLSARQLSEEVNEFMDAHEEGNYVGCVDAVIDNMVFGLGILYKLGLTHDEFEKCFAAVMNANYTKKKGVKEGREGFDAVDAIKPEDFVPPEVEIARILDARHF